MYCFLLAFTMFRLYANRLNIIIKSTVRDRLTDERRYSDTNYYCRARAENERDRNRTDGVSGALRRGDTTFERYGGLATTCSPRSGVAVTLTAEVLADR